VAASTYLSRFWGYYIWFLEHIPVNLRFSPSIGILST